jgi:predicted TIM-barrel fold metal-dependent hydrolase
MNSDKLGETKPYLSKDPRMNEAWRKIMEKHQEAILSCAVQCPNKFMFATDGPFAMRQDIALNLYREAFADDKELLNKILGENARKLYKL